MLCDDCKKRPASVHVTRIHNNQKKEAHLCQECAQKHGEFKFLFPMELSMPNLLSGFFNLGHPVFEGVDGDEISISPSFSELPSQCENCGLTYKDFRQLSQLGCNHCYDHFSMSLDPLLRRIHGNTRHTGKVPKRRGGKISIQKQIEQLRSKLQEAVMQEKYEQAAKLRDQIRALEGQSGEGKSK